MIQYTSGTTGFPKGALLRHRGLLNNGADTADRMGYGSGDVFVTTMPLFHTGGCVCCVIGAVYKAATQVLIEAFDPAIVLELFDTYRGAAMVGVPTMLIAMLEHPNFATTDLSGGQGDLLRRLAPCRRRWCGGSRKSSARPSRSCSARPSARRWRPRPPPPTASRTRPAPSACRCRTWKSRSSIPSTGETVPIGTIGEFCTRGYHVMLGYFEMPDATAAADRQGRLAAHRRSLRHGRARLSARSRAGSRT